MRRALLGGRAVLRAAASGYGQMLFAESPWSGVLLLGGIAALAPAAAWPSALGCAVATVAARALEYPRPAWRRGLYGYSGALLGLFWGMVFPCSPMHAVLLAAAAAATVPLTWLTHRLLTPRGLPALALPALIPAWLATLVVTPAPTSPPLSDGMMAAGWVLTVLALAVSSPLLAMAALLGGIIGFELSVLLTGAVDSGILSNSFATAAALGSVFLPWSLGALLIGAAGAALAGALWWCSAPLLLAIGVPGLGAPFTIVTLALLAALQAQVLRRRIPGRPAPLPITSIASAEHGRSVYRARRRLYELVLRADRVCVLTGAGVSTESGLPDVRGPSGIWNDQPPVCFDELLRSPEARARFWADEERFYRLVRRATPGRTHAALAELARRGVVSAVVTQNVDGLHQAAGVPDAAVIEIHGSIHKARCVDCEAIVARDTLAARIARGEDTLYCDRCQGILKSGSVLFGEELNPDRLQAALRALLDSDLLLVLGTSLTVAPAAEMVRWARDAGLPVAIVNGGPTPHDHAASVTVMADLGATMTDLVDLMPARRAAAPTCVPQPV